MRRLQAALLAIFWPQGEEDGWDLEEEALWLRDKMADVCDVAMLRAKSRPRRAVNLRHSTVQARRIFMRARHRGDVARITAAYGQ